MLNVLGQINLQYNTIRATTYFKWPFWGGPKAGRCRQIWLNSPLGGGGGSLQHRSRLFYLDDLLVVGLLVCVLLKDALVGDQREGEHAHLAVPGNQDFRNCAHA